MKKAIKRITAVAVSAAEVLGTIALSAPAYAASKQFSPDTIAVGENHSLVIRSDNSLWAAGDNSHGQLGVSGVDESKGVKVMSNVVFVEANDDTSFAIDTSGTLFAWGDNSEGQANPGSNSSMISKPTKVLGDVIYVSAGDTHTVAITADGTAYGWGSNDYGELGMSPNNKRNGVTEILKDVTDTAAGDGFTLLVTSDGSLYSCGNNEDGQLGCASYNDVSRPTLAVSSGVAKAEAGNSHSVILKTDGSVWTAGINENGQLGNKNLNQSNKFVSINLKNMTEVFAGGDSSGALNSSGSMYTWGANSFGQLHNSKNENVDTPASVGSSAVSVALGEHHSLLLNSSGKVAAAGSGGSGELFTETVGSALEPERIMEYVTSYSAGIDHAAAVDEDGHLYTWGSNDCGQLGLGDYDMRTVPTRVTSIKADITGVWCGNKTTFAYTADGIMYVFGDNSQNLLGVSTRSNRVSTPQKNPNLSDFGDVEIYPSENFCLALLDGVVYGWGNNSSGRLLDCRSNVKIPTELSDSLLNVTKLAVGYNHCLALTGGGSVLVWGSNTSGQLGMPYADRVVDETPLTLEITNSKDEVQESSFTDIAAAASHSMAIGVDGRVWVFGINGSGQLGTSEYRSKFPSAVTKDATQVIAGNTACAVIFNDDSMSMSGSNGYGALGDGTVKDSTSFLGAMASEVSQADIGDGFGGYVRNDGDLFCWGNNTIGQVGNGKGGASKMPEYVISDALLTSVIQAESIAFDKTEITVKPTYSAQLKIVTKPSDAVVPAVTWSSSNANVATVSDTGLVKGISNGTATITAKTASGLTATCKVSVNVAVTSFTVSPTKKTLSIDKELTLKSKIYPSNATDKTLLFESSDEDVAIVDENGKITAVAPGKAVITATAKSNPKKTRKVTITVRPDKVVITSRKSDSTGITLKWKDADGAEGYEVFRKLSGSSAKAKSIGDAGDDNSFTDDTAKKGKVYIYSVKSYVEVNGKKIYSATSKQYKIKAK